MGVVLSSGGVRPGDTIKVELPPQPYQRLDPVRTFRKFSIGDFRRLSRHALASRKESDVQAN